MKALFTMCLILCLASCGTESKTSVSGGDTDASSENQEDTNSSEPNDNDASGGETDASSENQEDTDYSEPDEDDDQSCDFPKSPTKTVRVDAEVDTLSFHPFPFEVFGEGASCDFSQYAPEELNVYDSYYDFDGAALVVEVATPGRYEFNVSCAGYADYDICNLGYYRVELTVSPPEPVDTAELVLAATAQQQSDHPIPVWLGTDDYTCTLADSTLPNLTVVTEGVASPILRANPTATGTYQATVKCAVNAPDNEASLSTTYPTTFHVSSLD